MKSSFANLFICAMLFSSVSNVCVEKSFFNQLALQIKAVSNKKFVVLLEVHNSKEMKALGSISELINDAFREKIFVQPYLICHKGNIQKKLVENIYVVSANTITKSKMKKIGSSDLSQFLQDNFPDLEIKKALEKFNKSARHNKGSSTAAKVSNIEIAAISGQTQLLQINSNRGIRFLVSFVILIFTSMLLFFFVKTSVDIATFSLGKLHQDKEFRSRIVCDKLNKKVYAPRD